jgi:DNA polymerase-3 subunit gamma/tau
LSYQALYRKFRPSEFESVKGQEHIVTTLKNQIRTGRIGHAYLFCGTRGTGKTTVAKILAKAVNCESPIDGSPCGHCPSCMAISRGSNTNIIEIDAASNNSVDNIREIREEVAYRPTEGKYKVYIIDEVHMLSTGAFNALLKTLEEPPEYVIFILATTEAAKIPVTILSRCQRYDFRRMNVDTIAGRLKELLDIEKIDYEEKGIRYIARLGDGSMRDALSLLDQCISCFVNEELTYDKILSVLGKADIDQFANMLESVSRSDVAGCVRNLDAFIQEGKEMTHFASDFTWYMRNLLLIKNADGLEDILDMSTENLARMKEAGEKIDDNTLMRYIRIFSELSGQLKNITQKRVYVEMALIRMCRPQMETDNESLRQRISQIEEKLENGNFTPVFEMPAKVSEEKPSYEHAKPKQKEIKKAAPDELVRICELWPKIIMRMPSELLKTYLKTSQLRYDSDTGESRLYIFVNDEVALMYLKKENNINVIKETIIQLTNRSVDLEVVDDKVLSNKNLEDIPLDKKISEVIGMPVEIE